MGVTGEDLMGEDLTGPVPEDNPKEDHPDQDNPEEDNPEGDHPEEDHPEKVPDARSLTPGKVDALERGDPLYCGDQLLVVDAIEHGPFLALTASALVFACSPNRTGGRWVFNVE